MNQVQVADLKPGRHYLFFDGDHKDPLTPWEVLHVYSIHGIVGVKFGITFYSLRIWAEEMHEDGYEYFGPITPENCGIEQDQWSKMMEDA